MTCDVCGADEAEGASLGARTIAPPYEQHRKPQVVSVLGITNRPPTFTACLCDTCASASEEELRRLLCPTWATEGADGNQEEGDEQEPGGEEGA